MRIGFIGLGNMGFPIAANLVADGRDVTVFDLRPEAVQQLVAKGAKGAVSVSELAAGADLIQIVVVTDAQLDAVVMDPTDGVLASARPGSIILVHSSVHPDECRRLGAAAQAKGVALLDAPVSGTEVGALARTLAIMVGGDAAILEKCRSILEPLAGSVTHVGELGMGQVAKLVNNAIAGSMFQAASEGMRLASLCGIEEDRILAAMSGGTTGSWVLDHWSVVRRLAHTFRTGPDGLAEIVRKDLNHAIAVAHDVGLELPMAAAAEAAAAGNEYWARRLRA
jgi:3-hydroxyisobutyrate dehydrogenase-like beta-hydroxyacid dehydrogenase